MRNTYLCHYSFRLFVILSCCNNVVGWIPGKIKITVKISKPKRLTLHTTIYLDVANDSFKSFILTFQLLVIYSSILLFKDKTFFLFLSQSRFPWCVPSLASCGLFVCVHHSTAYTQHTKKSIQHYSPYTPRFQVFLRLCFMIYSQLTYVHLNLIDFTKILKWKVCMCVCSMWDIIVYVDECKEATEKMITNHHKTDWAKRKYI